jgi:integrase
MIESWISGVDRAPATRAKTLVLLHGIFKRARKVYGLPTNPAAEVERPPIQQSGNIEVFSLEEVMALVRAAASAQDAAIYLTAAFTGLRRGELLALRWRDVDFSNQVVRVRASYADGALTTPKSGKVHSVPMAPDVAEALAKLGQRASWTDDDDLVFVGQSGSYLDVRALRTPVRRGAQTSRSPQAPLPRPPPHLRHPHDRQGRHSPSSGVDGPRG